MKLICRSLTEARALLLFILPVALFISCKNSNDQTADNAAGATSSTPIINYSVTNVFPHDTASFTEGLVIHNGQLVESTGSPEYLASAKSIIGVVDLKTGKIDKKVEIDRTKFFGEGIVYFKDKLYQLTYQNQLGFIYDAKTYKPVGKFSYSNKEGWSLTTNGTELIMSDGTEYLSFLNPADLKPTKTLKVTEGGFALKNLNELEYINGYIYSNIWLTSNIVKIDPSTGKVVGKLDLSSLSNEAKNKNPSSDVLNGIAYDSAANKIFVTGKLWANIYQIDFAH